MHIHLRQSPAHRKNVLIIGYSLIGLGITGGLLSLLIFSHAHPPAAPQVIAPSAAKPTPTQVTSYTVAPDLPKYITIPSIGVPKTRVIQLGVTKNNQIATPNNIYDTGWYNASAKPGQPGAMFIFGHVSSWQANGVFYNLKKIKPGDAITIQRGDNTIFTYKVASTKVYPATQVDMHAVLSPISSSVAGLNLMTCTGTVIKGTSEFTQRLVVFSSLSK